jgi:protease IV
MATLFRPFKWLLQTIWRLLNFTRQLVINLFFLLLVLLAVVALSQDEQEKLQLKEGALVLNLSGQLVEQSTVSAPSSQLLQKWLAGDEVPRETRVSDVVYAIQQAATDPKIKGIVLQLQDLEASNLSKLGQITRALDNFRRSGKPVIASGDFFVQHQYLLAAHADQILLDPAGAVMLQGLGLYNFYYKSALQKFNITPHVFRVGTYKSFVEPYTRDDMSPEAREANSRWLGQLWQAYVQDAATARKIAADAISPSKEQLLSRLKAANGNAAQYALSQKLVDKLANQDERTRIIAKFAGSADDETGYQHVSLRDYVRGLPEQYPDHQQPKIGLIVAAGTIQNGEQAPGTIGGESLAKLLRATAKDPEIKALVLRIDSPGGSAFAAEQIRAELQAIQQAGKPVVVSMGSMAASGGYWIAADADRIFAEPTTLTGSIGVFGLFASFDKALEYVGIHTDGIATTDFAGIDPSRPLPDHIKQVIQMNVENTYQRFIELVAKGRKMTPEAVDKIAQGRVWSGVDAKELGLVDELGSQADAIAAAAKLAKLTHYQVEPVEPKLSASEQLMKQLFAKAARVVAPEALQQLSGILGRSQQVLAPLNRLDDPQGQYVLSPVLAP